VDGTEQIEIVLVPSSLSKISFGETDQEWFRKTILQRPLLFSLEQNYPEGMKS
jgi:hypothetical protein